MSYETNHTLKTGIKVRGEKSLIFQCTVVCMHISWFIHIAHRTARALRPKPRLKGLSSKASEKMTSVFSRAARLS